MKGIVFFSAIICFIGVIQAQTLLGSGVSCAEKKIAVDTHNALRAAVAGGKLANQPKAGNMQKMIWDDQLAVVAQNWANKMVSDHNSGRSDLRFSVGENIYESTSSSGSNTTAEWKRCIDKWHSEHLAYKFCETNGCGNTKTGHYTQVVWSNSVYLGCGFAFYKSGNGFYKYYVCNYGPAGNFLNQFPYKVGPGCDTLCCDIPCNVLYGSMCK